MANPPPPWSQLPTELLHFISQKLADSDFIRFRCVCRSWRHAAKPSDLPPQLPWLLLPGDPDYPESIARSFFSFGDKSTRTLFLPETSNQNICGSSNGWLIMFDRTLDISLFNPITRSLIRLPHITSFPEDYGFQFSETVFGDACVVYGDDDEFPLEDMADFFHCFAFLYSDPESGNVVDGVVAFMAADSPQIIQYCKVGDAGWTVIDPGLGRGINTMSFHNGSFYFVDSMGRTAVCELGPVKKEAVLIPPANLARRRPCHCTCHYLVTFREELLLVSCHKNYIADNYFDFDEMIFEYHKLEVDSSGQMTWSRIEGTGDCTVFLTDGWLHSTGRLTTVASNAPGYRKDRVYYVIPSLDCPIDGLSHMHVIIVDGGDIGVFDGPWTEWETNPMSSWIVPSLF